MTPLGCLTSWTHGCHSWAWCCGWGGPSVAYGVKMTQRGVSRDHGCIQLIICPVSSKVRYGDRVAKTAGLHTSVELYLMSSIQMEKRGTCIHLIARLTSEPGYD